MWILWDESTAHPAAFLSAGHRAGSCSPNTAPDLVQRCLWSMCQLQEMPRLLIHEYAEGAAFCSANFPWYFPGIPDVAISPLSSFFNCH